MMESLCRNAETIRHGVWVPAFAGTTAVNSIDRPDQGLDLVGVRAEVLGELVEIGIGDLLKARLVDIGNDLDAHFLELGRGRALQFERALPLLDADVPG